MSENEIQAFGMTEKTDTVSSGQGEFHHSKKRHERRTLTSLHIVLIVMSVVWLVPFFFLVCQSGRSFVLEGGGMVNYVMPREGFSLDNYKALFIRDFNIGKYTGGNGGMAKETFFEYVKESDLFTEQEKADVAVVEEYWATSKWSKRISAIDKAGERMKTEIDKGEITDERIIAAYTAVFTGDGRMMQKKAYAAVLDEDFGVDFRQGFIPWWGNTFLLAAVAALVTTLGLAGLRLLIHQQDIAGWLKWLLVYLLMQVIFLLFLMALMSYKGFSISTPEGLGRGVIAFILMFIFGAMAAAGFLKEDARLLRMIPGYPAQSRWAEVRKMLALFGELFALFVLLVCMLVPLSSSTYVTWYTNTLTIALFVAVIQTIIVLSVSYALSRIRFKGRKLLMNCVLVLGMFPGFLTMIVLYYILKTLGLTHEGAIPGLILIYCASSGMGYYISKGFFDTIPKSLDESARIDGATRLQVFLKIIMPLAKPIVIYTILMAFMSPWGDYVFASYVAGTNHQSFNVAVGLFRWVNDSNYRGLGYFPLFCAGGVLVAVPITALFLALQKYYVEGVTGGAVKG